MAFRNTPFVQNEYYHIYNRGVEKRKIFLDKKDYEHFLFLIYVCNSEKSIVLRNITKDFTRGAPLVAIGAFCLMPNHFHILIKPLSENGVSVFMKKLLTAYSMYFNKKYKRTGHLFEGVFRSKHVSNDKYMKYMYAYIHLNPAKLKDRNWKGKRGRNTLVLLDFIKKYPYSSMQQYQKIDSRVFGNDILNIKEFPSYFAKPEDYSKELFDWLSSPDT
jgi:putative transposase